MKKAVKIVGIVYIPLLIISFFVYLLYGGSCAIARSDSKMLNEIAGQLEAVYGAEFSLEYVSRVLSVATVFLFIGAALTIVGLIIDIIMVVHISKENEKYSSASWIVLGVLGIVFGACVEGILAIVYGAKGGSDSTPNGTIQEVHYEEKKEEDNKPDPSDYDAPDHLE